MSEQVGQLLTQPQSPSLDDRDGWRAYWKAHNQPWRTEPEIDTKRQKELAQRRDIVPNIEKGIYPFKGMKLSRADVEWLLATHENGRGPVDWSDESQRKRRGLDLRSTDLRQVNLHNLPLARILGGLPWDEWDVATPEQREMATVHMEDADLRWAHLERAYLSGTHLERANLRGAHMTRAFLIWVHLEDADLRWAHLERADLDVAHLERADLRGARLGGAELEGARLDDEKHASPRLADIRWGDINLTVVNWTAITMLGDERVAEQKSWNDNGEVKSKETRFTEYDEAVRANRQLTAVLRDQGLSEEADYFAYRAQRLKRIVLRRLVYLPGVSLWQRVRALGSYIFLLFLDILAGYGYRPVRSLCWYLVVIFGFALAYYAFGHLSLFPPDAFVYSLTSFHGRGFFPGLEHRTSLHDPLIMLAAIEAVIGLFIEISFIATFTQRYFGR